MEAKRSNLCFPSASGEEEFHLGHEVVLSVQCRLECIQGCGSGNDT